MIIFVKYTSILLSFLLALNFFAWSIACFSFNQGYEIAEKEYKNEKILNNEIVFSGANGPNSYEFLHEQYVICCVFSILLLICSLFNLINNSILNISIKVVNIFLLIYLGLVSKMLILPKSPEMNESFYIPYNSLIRDSVLFDWLSVYIIGILFVIQLIELANIFFYKKDNSINNVK